MSGRRVAVVGARAVPSREALHDLVDTLCDLEHNDVVVSGGADGIDSVAEAIAKALHLLTDIRRPKYDIYPGKLAPLHRNTEVAETSTECVAYTKGSRGGTFDTIRKFNEREKPVREFMR